MPGLKAAAGGSHDVLGWNWLQSTRLANADLAAALMSAAASLPLQCSWCTAWGTATSPLSLTLILARRFLQRPPPGTSDAESAAHDEAAVQELRTAIAAGLPCVVQLMVRAVHVEWRLLQRLGLCSRAAYSRVTTPSGICAVLRPAVPSPRQPVHIQAQPTLLTHPAAELPAQRRPLH